MQVFFHYLNWKSETFSEPMEIRDVSLLLQLRPETFIIYHVCAMILGYHNYVDEIQRFSFHTDLTIANTLDTYTLKSLYNGFSITLPNTSSEP